MTITAMAGFITLGIIIYLIINCIEALRLKANQKKIVIDDTEI